MDDIKLENEASDSTGMEKQPAPARRVVGPESEDRGGSQAPKVTEERKAPKPKRHGRA